MNSIAQHAVPNGSGQSELPRAQFTIVSTLEVRYVAPASSSISRSDSPGSVISPFSACSPGTLPGLRATIELVGLSMSVGILGGPAILWAREIFHKLGGRARVLRHVQPLVGLGEEAIGLGVVPFIQQLRGLDECPLFLAERVERGGERIRARRQVPVVDAQMRPVDAEELALVPIKDDERGRGVAMLQRNGADVGVEAQQDVVGDPPLH